MQKNKLLIVLAAGLGMVLVMKSRQATANPNYNAGRVIDLGTQNRALNQSAVAGLANNLFNGPILRNLFSGSPNTSGVNPVKSFDNNSSPWSYQDGLLVDNAPSSWIDHAISPNLSLTDQAPQSWLDGSATLYPGES